MNKRKDGYKESDGDISRTWRATSDTEGYWIEEHVNTTVDRTAVVPAYCPICSFIMGGGYDKKVFYQFGCCEKCYIHFIEGQPMWKNNWPPSGDQYNYYINKRKKIDFTPVQVKNND